MWGVNMKEFEQQLMELYYNKQQLLYKEYTEDEAVNFNEVDQQIYNLLRETDLSKHRFLYREYINCNPLVSELLHKIDNLTFYETSLTEEERADKTRYKIAVSKAMKSDVIKLMRLRDKLSRYLGYNLYLDVMLGIDGFRQNTITQSLEDFLDEFLPTVKMMVADQGIKWDSWFNDLDQVGQTNKSYDSEELVETFLSKLNLKLNSSIDIRFDQKAYASFALPVSKENTKVVIKSSDSLRDVLTLFHELGHAMYYSFIEGDGVQNILPPSLDEVMAVVMEFIAVQIMFEDEEKEKLNELMVLEYTRCAISSLFEIELWNNTSDAEELYIKHYSKLGVEIGHPELWSYDSFRSFDSVYIHNYTVGFILAIRLYKFFNSNFDQDYSQWGSWIKENIYQHGSKIKLSDILSLID